MKEVDKQIAKIRIYLHYKLTQSALRIEMGRKGYPVLTFEEFCNKPIDPWTGTTKLYEWKWKFPNI